MSTAVSRIKEKAHSVLRFLAAEALELDAWCLRFFSVAPASSRSSSSKSPSKSDMVEKVRKQECRTKAVRLYCCVFTKTPNRGVRVCNLFASFGNNCTVL